MIVTVTDPVVLLDYLARSSLLPTMRHCAMVWLERNGKVLLNTRHGVVEGVGQLIVDPRVPQTSSRNISDLTEQQRAHIRRSKAKTSELADRYNVSVNTIAAVQRAR